MTPTQALITAWTEPGLHPWWHKKAQRAVRDAMPLVARALDDLVKEHGQ